MTLLDYNVRVRHIDGLVGIAAAGREDHMVPVDLEADTGRAGTDLVDTGLVAVGEEGIQVAQSQEEVDNSHAVVAAAVDKEAGRGEGLDNIRSLAGVLVPEEGVVHDRNLVDEDSFFSRDIQSE